MRTQYCVETSKEWESRRMNEGRDWGLGLGSAKDRRGDEATRPGEARLID